MKKAYLRDLSLLVGTILGLVFTIFLVSVLNGAFNTGFAGVTTDANVLAIFGAVDNFLLFVDKMLPIVVIGLMLGIWFLTYLLPSNPLMFWLSLLPTILVLYLSFIPNNIAYAFMNNPIFATQLNDFLISKFLASNLPMLMLITMVGANIILYSKVSNPQGAMNI